PVAHELVAVDLDVQRAGAGGEPDGGEGRGVERADVADQVGAEVQVPGDQVAGEEDRALELRMVGHGEAGHDGKANSVVAEEVVRQRAADEARAEADGAALEAAVVDGDPDEQLPGGRAVDAEQVAARA